MTGHERKYGTALTQTERLLFGAGRRYIPVPEALGAQPAEVEAVLSSQLGRLSGRLRADLRWHAVPPEIRIVRIGRFNTANDRARVVPRVATSDQRQLWLEQRVNPVSVAFLPALPLLLAVSAIVQRDLPMVIFWILFWLLTRSLVEAARRADSRLLQRLLNEVAERAVTDR